MSHFTNTDDDGYLNVNIKQFPFDSVTDRDPRQPLSTNKQCKSNKQNGSETMHHVKLSVEWR